MMNMGPMPDPTIDVGPIRKPGLERWPTRGMFVASAIALVCGPAMVWRFPALALRHGGGNFLFAFAIALVVTGLPLLVLELAVGQQTQRAAPRALRMTHRPQEWLGWAAVAVGARALALAVPAAQAAAGAGDGVAWHDPVEFVFRALHGTSGPGGWMLPPWLPVVALLVVWALCGVLASSGPRRFGVVVRWLLTCSLVVLLAVVARQLGTLAANEADTANNGLFVALCSAALSFVVWLGVACTLGMLAMRDGRLMAEVATRTGPSADGIGLALLVIPQAMLPGSGSDPSSADAAWMAALYVAIAGLAIASSVVLLHGTINALQQRFARSRVWIGLILTAAGFVGSLLLSGVVGWHWFDTADNLLVRWGLPLVALLQCIGLGWIAGTGRWREQIVRNSELAVRIVTPLVLVILLANALARLAG